MADADEEKEPLLPGAIVGGKYKLVEPAGAGGMGSVWRAENVGLGSAVAIKFLHMSVSKAPEVRARFEREARICAKLGDESLHIVKVTDFGVTDFGRPFLVMELLKGESLFERLEREGRLPVPTASTIATQLCRALHVAHVAGIVHRDLKPANVFLCRGAGNDVHVKLLDFGVAKATLDMDSPQVTRAGFIVGTPAYMSPEQITGQPVDARADLWAVAAIVYRMVVGAPPFGNGSIGELGRRITTERPLLPSKIAEDLPPELDEWVTRGLAKKRDERFQTTSDLSDALAEVAKHAPRDVAVRRIIVAAALDSPRISDDSPTRAASFDATTRVATPAADVDAKNAPTMEERTPGPAASRAPAAQRRPRPAPIEDDEPAEEWKPPRSYTWPIALVLLVAAAGGAYYAYRHLGWFQPSSPSTEPSASTSPSSSSPSSSNAASASPSTSSSAALSTSTSSSAEPTTSPSTSASVAAPSASSASTKHPLAPPLVVPTTSATETVEYPPPEENHPPPPPPATTDTAQPIGDKF